VIRTRTHRADRGATIPLVALSLTVIMISVAFAVDLGRQRTERRDMQAIADVVSLDLTRKLEGRTAGEVEIDPDFLAALQTSAARNAHPSPVVPCPAGDITDRCVTFVLGTVDDATNDFTPCPDSACIPTAVQVTAGADVDYLFQPGSGDTRRVAVSRVGANEQAYFKVGSSLLSLNPASRTIIAQILQRTIPDAQVLSYEGLVDANVRIDRLGAKLGIPVTVASPEELLATTVTFRQLAVATAEVLQEDGGSIAAISALNDFRSRELPGDEVSFGRLIGANLEGGSPAGSAEVNFLQMISAGAFLIDGEHFVTVPGAELDVAGLASLDVRLTGIEAPQIGGPNDGDSVTTSQVHLEITPTFAISEADVQQACNLSSGERGILNSLIGGLLNLVSCLLPPAPYPISAEITGSPTISLDLAQMTVEQQIDCPAKALTLNSTPSVVDLLTDFDLAVSVTWDGSPLGDLARLRFEAGAQTIGTTAPQVFTGVDPGTVLPTGVEYTEFDPPEARVGSNPLGLSGLLHYDAAEVTLLGEGLNLPGFMNRVLTQLVDRALDRVMAELDQKVIQRVSRLLGIHFGGADLTPLSLRCDESAVMLVG